MAPDNCTPAFYGSLLPSSSGSITGRSSEFFEDSYPGIVLDREREAAGLKEFRRSLGFLELPNVEQRLSIFGAEPGGQMQSRAVDAGHREQPMQGILDIYIHHAFGIHNICIYQDQDVYAKFSLTHSDAEALRTKVVKGGGRNPIFNDRLQIAINHRDPVLKCEIWMKSDNVHALEDQMLAFVLVPLAGLQGKTDHTKDHELVSTDLFHSPNGVLRLALAFHECTLSPTAYADVLNRQPNPPAYNEPGNSFSSYQNHANVSAFNLGSLASLSRSVPIRLALDATVAEGGSVATVLGSPSRSVFEKVEFPDMRVACENQQLVSDYLSLASTDLTLVCPSEGDFYGKQSGVEEDRMISFPAQTSFTSGAFLQLGSFPFSGSDYDMVSNSVDRELKKADCPLRGNSLSIYNSSGLQALDECRILSSAATSAFESLSDRDSSETFARVRSESAYNSSPTCVSNESRSSSGAFTSSQRSTSPRPPPFFTSSLSTGSSGDSLKIADPSSVGEQFRNNLSRQIIQSRPPLGLLDDRAVVPQDIVDLYMKSLHQFSDSISNMQIPAGALKDVSSSLRDSEILADTRKRIPTRVFYGSRAFF